MNELTHWGRVTHICVSSLTIIGSDNGLSPDQRQAMIWTNAGILIIRTLGIHFSKIFIKIHTFSLKKGHLKMSFVKWRPFCLGLNVLKKEQRAKQQRARGMKLSFFYKLNIFYFIMSIEGKCICCHVCMKSYDIFNIHVSFSFCIIEHLDMYVIFQSCSKCDKIFGINNTSSSFPNNDD